MLLNILFALMTLLIFFILFTIIAEVGSWGANPHLEEEKAE